MAASCNPHPGVRPDWLALTQEDALDPAQPIIDAHHHLWAKPGDTYMVDAVLADFCGGHRIVASVFVEGETAQYPDGPEELRPVGETEMAASAAKDARTRGDVAVAGAIVARADLTLGSAVAPVLEAHAVAGQGLFRGIRHSTPWHADPSAHGSSRLTPAGLLYDPTFRQGLAELQHRNLVFDAWMYHSQLSDVVELAQAMPNLKIVVNHTGGPLGIGPYTDRRDDVFVDWRHWIQRLAKFPNVSMKLGGLGMRMCGFELPKLDRPPGSAQLAKIWQRYIETCIEEFGPSRCMFESNFPVDKGSVSYTILWNTFKRLAAPYSASERSYLFFETANRAYLMNIDTPLVAG